MQIKRLLSNDKIMYLLSISKMLSRFLEKFTCITSVYLLENFNLIYHGPEFTRNK